MLDKYKLWIKFKILLYKFTSFPTSFEVQFHLESRSTSQKKKPRKKSSFSFCIRSSSSQEGGGGGKK